MVQTHSLINASDFLNAACPLHEDARMVRRSLGAPNQAFRRMSAAIKPSLVAVLAQSLQRRDNDVSIADPMVGSAVIIFIYCPR